MVKSQSVSNLLFKYEQQINLVDKKLIHQTIENAIDEREISFIIFSCLATKRGKEEIIIDFFKTLFFDGGLKEISRNFKRALQIVQEIEDLGISVKVIPILVDTEPRRTWGWQIPQDELTIICEIMLEQAKDSKLLPENWQPKLWSELESCYSGHWTSASAIEWARGMGKQTLCVHQQIKHLAKFSDRYHFPFGLKETAVRQVGSYAFEGVILGGVFPNAILMQSEYPWTEKDILYQWLREKEKPLPIIHPFPN